MMISLPSKWVRLNGLDKGSEINLEELKEGLLVSTSSKEIKTETSIKLTGLTESSIRTMITNTYRLGYDKIKVEFENTQQFVIMKEVVDTRLIGFEIINKKGNFCIVENVTEPSGEQFENILDKIFMNIEEMFSVTKKRLDGTKEDYEDLSSLIQKYDNFCRRIIIKRKFLEKNSEMFWAFLSSIIRGYRDLYYLNKIIDNVKVNKKTVELLNGCEKIFILLIDSYKNKKIENLGEIHKLEKDLILGKAYSLIEKTSGKENIIVYRIMSSIRQFYQGVSPLTGLIA